MKQYGPYLIFGALFGLGLSRAGVTHFENITGMFQLDNPQLYFVIGTAFVLNLIAFQVMRRIGVSGRNGMPLNLPDRTFHPGILPGAMIFGIGWAITGVCPSTAMIQLGEGHAAALITVAGIFVGSWIYPRVHARFFGWQASRCGE